MGNQGEREEIWTKLLHGARLEPGIDYGLLAVRELGGGEIINIVRRAILRATCRDEPVRMMDLLRIARETRPGRTSAQNGG